MLIRNILSLCQRNLGDRLFGALIPILLVSACTSWLPEAHKIDTQQGKAIKRETLAKIQPGMSMATVVTILGTPTFTDPFHTQRWDYIYSSKLSNGERQASRLSLFFDNGVLKRVDDSAYRETP